MSSTHDLSHIMVLTGESAGELMVRLHISLAEPVASGGSVELYLLPEDAADVGRRLVETAMRIKARKQ